MGVWRERKKMKKTERKRSSLLANLGDINRPLRVRPVRYMSREWWAVDAEDTWPGMVMDLRRLGFESVALADEVLVREGGPMYEPQLEGPMGPESLKPMPLVSQTITIHKDLHRSNYSYTDYYDSYALEDEEEEVVADGEDEDDDEDTIEDLDID
jgi:hypothetical protein